MQLLCIESIETCVHTCIHTYMHTYMHAQIYTYIHTYIHAYIQTYKHQKHTTSYIHSTPGAYALPCMLTYIPTALPTSLPAFLPARLPTYIHTHTNTHIYIYIYTYTYLQTYIHTQPHIYTDTYSSTITAVSRSLQVLYDISQSAMPLPKFEPTARTLPPVHQASTTRHPTTSRPIVLEFYHVSEFQCKAQEYFGISSWAWGFKSRNADA